MSSKLIEIYSQIDPSQLLHQIILPSTSSTTERLNASPPGMSLQVAFISLKDGQTFRPHRHIIHERSMPIAQESWVVLRGMVEVTYYDLDDSIHSTCVLNQFSATITYQGGHNYRALTDDTMVYEYKTGPYLGQAYDKVFI